MAFRSKIGPFPHLRRNTYDLKKQKIPELENIYYGKITNTDKRIRLREMYHLKQKMTTYNKERTYWVYVC